MKSLIAMLVLATVSTCYADELATPPAPAPTHRYIIERTLPRGALERVDSAVKEKVNQNNASLGVRWVQSYANADETKTYCVYEGPSEAAVRKAAELNKLPVDSVTEVPIELESEAAPGAAAAVQRK